jgi:protein-L-isoaspartate O-methyltransferase
MSEHDTPPSVTEQIRRLQDQVDLLAERLASIEKRLPIDGFQTGSAAPGPNAAPWDLSPSASTAPWLAPPPIAAPAPRPVPASSEAPEQGRTEPGDEPMREERSHLRATFDEVALLYDQARPGYPEALFDDVVSLAGIRPGGRILEIGCGTGQATAPLARRGHRILCIELGENLAAVARHNLAAYPQVEVHTGAFEEWPVEEGAFDLVVAATAFHWLDPTLAYPKTARALRSGGAIALFWNFHLQAGTSRFFEAAYEIYRREAPQLAEGARPLLPGTDEPPEAVKGEIENTGLFGEVTARRYRWDLVYDATNYLRFLDTLSGHRNLDSAARERLFRGIAELIDTMFNGHITKSYLTTLYVAHPLEAGQHGT